MTTIKILVPSFITREEKQDYIKEYLEQGYVVSTVCDYDTDSDVYVLEKPDCVKLMLPNYISEDQKQITLNKYLSKGYKIKQVYEHDVDNDIYVLVV